MNAKDPDETMDHTHHWPHVSEFSYALAFMSGLMAAGHCLGMCGGLVSAFFMKLQARGPWPYLGYHAARLTVYAIIGFLAALLGTVLVSTGRLGLAQGVLQIIAGLIVIVLGLDVLGLSPIRNAYGFAPIAWLRRQFLLASQRGPLIGSLIGGALNGLMPCSLTMAMAVQATTAQSPLTGMLLMLAFGAGTLPAMLFAALLFGKLAPRLRGLLHKGAALLVIALGCSTLWQGLSYFGILFRLLV